jgi:transmembrane sensor
MNSSAPNSPGAGRGTVGSSAPGQGQNPLDWAREIGAADRVIQDLDHYVRRRRRRRLQFAGGAGLFLVVTALLWQSWSTAALNRGAPSGGRALVLRPETRTLPDGSSVELSQGAAIEVTYGGSARRVALRGGAAHFAVVKDPARPFVVEASSVEARALGTAFLVEPAAAGVAVLVTEGQVAVMRSDTPAIAPRPAERAEPLAIVSAGEGVRLAPASTAHRAITAVPAAEFAELLAWRVPRLEFSDTPLAQVVTMFNSQGAARLVLDEKAVGTLKVSGVLRADDFDSLFRLLDGEFGLIAERRDGVWHLRRR